MCYPCLPDILIFLLDKIKEDDIFLLEIVIFFLKVTSKNPFRRLPAEFPPDCVKPPRNAESIASSAFLARQKFC